MTRGETPDRPDILLIMSDDHGYADRSARGSRDACFGKVHYGPERPEDRAWPENHGCDESLGGLAGLSMGRLRYLHHSRAAAGEQDPYFCRVAYNAVHNFAWQLPQDELDARALPRHDDFDPASTDHLDWQDAAISPHLEHRREYSLARLEIMDREIGRLLDHLEATGRRESTLVSSLDLLPTFAAAAGPDPSPAAPLDGRDLRTAWEAAASTPADASSTADGGGHEALYFDTGFQRAEQLA